MMRSVYLIITYY